jgi:hypothetical protein
LYHSGPHAQPQFLWNHYTLYFATDPVALDRVGWTVLDQKRIAAGMKPVAEAPPDQFSTFYFRRPEHIEIAGTLGLGVADPRYIYCRHIALDQPEAAPVGRSGGLVPLPQVGRVR